MAFAQSRKLSIAALLALAIFAEPTLAVEPGEALADPTLEARARAISTGLRCLVCQNQSIDDSSAPLAKDLRLLVRERLRAGDSDPAVTAYLVARYGNFVLLRPPVNVHTILLWTAPLLALLGTAYALFRVAGAGRSVPMAATGLDEEEERRLTDLLRGPPGERQ